MSETYVITFHVKPDQLQKFHGLLGPVLEAMSHEASFIHAALHVHPDQPSIVQLHETWTDREDVLNVQLKRPYRQQWHEALEDMLEKPREIQTWQLLQNYT